MEGAHIDSGLKLLVALLYSPGVRGVPNEPVRGMTRLEKLIFLLEKEGGFPQLHKFDPYDFGPWSSGEVHDEIETLIDAKLVEMRQEEVKVYAEVSDAKECVEHEAFDEDEVFISTGLDVYLLTEHGLKAGQKIFDSLPELQRNNLLKIKKNFNSIPLIDLLKYVYTKYPDMTKESKIKNQIISESLYGKRPKLSRFERDE